MQTKAIYLIGMMLMAVCATGLPGEAPSQTNAVSTIRINGRAVHPAHGTVAGLWFYSGGTNGAQVLLTGHGNKPGGWRMAASLTPGDSVQLELNVADITNQPPAHFTFRCEPLTSNRIECVSRGNMILLSAGKAPGAVRLSGFANHGQPISLSPVRRSFSRDPVACSPDPDLEISGAMVEWDWRMQDGIGTPRESRTYMQAVDKLFARMAEGGMSGDWFEKLRTLRPGNGASEEEWEAYWLRIHRERRARLLQDSQLADRLIFFVKHVPSVMSHQLTQVYGYCSRPGGGLFVLENPGASMRTWDMTPGFLSPGSFMTPELSFDATKLVFSFCPVQQAPRTWDYSPQTSRLRYHLYELTLADGSLRTLTRGDTDNFFPVYLPDGDILYSSTQRGGYHRCGRGPCFVYTLTRMGSGGEMPHSISYHETHEWDPCLLNDGRVLYTRWDYVDRNAVHYQQLWAGNPDGSNVRIYYGNNTWNPVGIWEARSVPGSSCVMATAAPHHGMSAGSIVLLDSSKGVDGLDPIKRLTRDVRFPESETPLARGPNPSEPYDFDTPVSGYWNSALRDSSIESQAAEEEKRWPGHCYKSPWPLSETLFLVSYSYDQLVGEPGPNIPNMFGLYLADAFGNKELLYRDPNISSLWARPLAARKMPPRVAGSVDSTLAVRNTGTFFLSDVMQSWPGLPAHIPIKHLRIIQVLLKTTPDSDTPRIAAGLGAPGRQVLGTVPVEADGSAFFEVPARTPVLFQALDERGRAVQTMRSLVYLQPGGHDSCVGCHENRMSGKKVRAQALALRRAPSIISSGPDGSRPFSYPRLVQPVLDQHCVKCHDGRVAGRPVLTGEPEGAFSKSYNALIGRVAYSAWGRPENNHEPLTEPKQFGALNSPLARMLDKGHNKVVLSAEEWDRFNTWMDANATFYGTFDAKEQKRQLAGEVISDVDVN